MGESGRLSWWVIPSRNNYQELPLSPRPPACGEADIRYIDN